MKVFKYLDFLKGKKTKIGAVFFTLAIIINLGWKLDIEGATIETLFWLLVEQTEVALSALFMMYGAIMKFIRLFQK